MATAAVTAVPPKAHESFWQRIEGGFLGFWKKVFSAANKELPTIEKGVDLTAKYVIPALDIAVAAAGGPAGIGAAAASAISDAQLGIATASSLVHDFGATPTAVSVAQGVSDNLKNVLTLAGVKDPQTVNAVTKAQAAVQQTVDGLSAAVAAQQTSQPQPATAN